MTEFTTYKIRVKWFAARNLVELEDSMNQFLGGLDVGQIVDVKVVTAEPDADAATNVLACVIYKERVVMKLK